MAMEQMTQPQTMTEEPRLRWQYLLTIFATISRPPVEALMLNRMLWERPSTSTKQSRSNHGSSITWPVPAMVTAKSDCFMGKSHCRKSTIGPTMSEV